MLPKLLVKFPKQVIVVAGGQRRFLSVKETLYRQQLMMEQRKKALLAGGGKKLRLIDRGGLYHANKGTRQETLERAKSSLSVAMEMGDIPAATLQLDILKKNGMDLLSPGECVQILEFVSGLNRTAVNASNSFIFLMEILNRREAVPSDDGAPPAPQLTCELVCATLQGLMNFQDGAKIEAVISGLIDNGIVLDESIVRLVLKHYSINGPLKSAEAIYEYCTKKQGLVPTEPLIGLMIDAYGFAKQPWRVMQILQDLETKEGDQITLPLIKKTLKAFAKSRVGDGIRVCLELVEKRGLERDSDFDDLLLNCYKLTGNSEKILEVYKEIVANSQNISKKTRSIMMDYFAKQGMMSEAVQILESCVASPNEGDVDVVMFNTILQGYRRQRDIEQVYYYYQLMLNCNVDPIIDTFNILISIHGLDLRQKDKATEYFDQCLSLNFVPNRMILGVMITVYAINKDFVGARKWYQELQNRGMVPSPAILCTMMQTEMLESSKDAFLAGSKYFDIAKELKCVTIDVCRSFAILHLVTGTSVLDTMEIFTKEMQSHSLQIDYKSLMLFSDAVLRPNTLYSEHVEMIMAEKSGGVAQNLFLEKKEQPGKSQYLYLYTLLQSQDRISSSQRSYFELALNTFND